jgi:glycolate oxidase FAD binding subunit
VRADAVVAGWQQLVRDAVAARRPLRPRGGGSKDFYGGPLAGEIVDTRAHTGIVGYEPTELVVTVRCGTPLADLSAALRAKGQWLPFEPPDFGGPGGTATVGGMVAAGIAGPGRMAAGAVRDFVLGVRLIDGRGELLHFGGEVMKNVAGYDVSRLLAGSLGTLGLITEVSLKVLPLPSAQTTCLLELEREAALAMMQRLVGQALPLTASAWVGGRLALRFAGAAPAVDKAAAAAGGERLVEDAGYWASLREQRHEFFAPALAGTRSLYRLALPAVAPATVPDADALIEWGGAQRWCYAEDPGSLRAAARAAGGVAVCFRAAAGLSRAEALPERAPAIRRIEKRLKLAFDPAGIFSVGRLGVED